MNQLDKLANKLTNRKTKKFTELHSFILIVLGASSFIVAGYFGLMLSKVVPEMIKTTNEHGLPLVAVRIWLLIAMYSTIVWYFGCIASRCHGLLYERWFK